MISYSGGWPPNNEFVAWRVPKGATFVVEQKDLVVGGEPPQTGFPLKDFENDVIVMWIGKKRLEAFTKKGGSRWSRLFYKLPCEFSSHKLHELFFGLFHDLGRDFGLTPFFHQPFNFPLGHGANEIGNVI